MHPSFFCITSSRNLRANALLRRACKNRKVRFSPINIDNTSTMQLPSVKGQMLYRVETTEYAKLLERMLLLQKDVTTFYSSAQDGIAKVDNVLTATLLHERAGLSIPATVYGLPLRKDLEAAVQTLGGFPIIIKAAGGSHGVGVMKVDSLSSLCSVLDYLRSMGDETNFILRQFIRTTSSARLVVLGKKVIDSIEYQVPSKDFRSNIGKTPTVVEKVFSPVVRRIATEAVRILGWEFGGVDILMDESGQPYLTEVNFPCYFARCQDCTGVDIAGKMVDYLLAKAAR